jgi:hypothetical protein
MSTASLGGLRNLGPRSCEWLARAGIVNRRQLARIGPLAAFQRVRRIEPRASLNLLYALVGAVENVHWTEVRRTRRLDLALALDAGRSAAGDLHTLLNVGPATQRDLARLGVTQVRQLARRSPDALFRALERVAGRQDPCVWDVFAAAVHQARGGDARPWWHFTAARKRRERAGTFVPRAPRAARPAR